MCKLVVHFYGCLTHAVFDAAAFQAYMIGIADFPFIFPMHFLAQKSNDVFRFYAVYGFALASPVSS